MEEQNFVNNNQNQTYYAEKNEPSLISSVTSENLKECYELPSLPVINDDINLYAHDSDADEMINECNDSHLGIQNQKQIGKYIPQKTEKFNESITSSSISDNISSINENFYE